MIWTAQIKWVNREGGAGLTHVAAPNWLDGDDVVVTWTCTGSTARSWWRLRLCDTAVSGEGVPVISGDGDVDDGVQRDKARAREVTATSVASWSDDGARPEARSAATMRSE